MQIEGKRIVLTGAASGIGRAVLEELAGFPVSLLAVDRDQNKLAEAWAQLAGCQAAQFSFSGDLGCQETVDLLFEQAQQQMGGIDLFIACAGFAYYERADQPDWEHLSNIYKVNVFSPIYTFTKLRAINPHGQFKMVFVASAMAQMSIPGYAVYSATKASLDRFAEGVRFELDDPRQLMLVYPIATRTNFFKSANQSTPIPWPSQTPQQVAHAIIRGIHADRLSVYPSLVFKAVLAVDRILPFTRRLYQRAEWIKFRNWNNKRV
jgi:short-subunit dehydrogenase